MSGLRYITVMDAQPPPPVLITGRVSRSASNVLELTFTDGRDDEAAEPLGVARQGGAEGAGGRLGILFGFKNGGLGRHSLTTRAALSGSALSESGLSGSAPSGSGSSLVIESKAGGESVVTGASGPVVRITRGETSSVVESAGGELLYTVVGDPSGVRTADAYCLVVNDAVGQPIGTLEVILTPMGWNITANTLLDLGFALSDVDYFVDRYVTRLGVPLKFPNLGTRLILNEQPSPEHLDALLGVCVDLSIGLRAYVAEMR
ncbi:MAG: hypothetical protein JWQ64_2437 [Subtercola sp.]|nr:hypothetical protein [Subtercola sp.]